MAETKEKITIEAVAKGSFSGIRASIVALESSVKLASGAFRAVQGTAQSFVGTALALRSPLNENRIAFEQQEHNVTGLAVAIGDMLLPGTIGLMSAVADVTKEYTELEKKQKEAFSKETADTIFEIARGLVSGVAVGARMSAQAFGMLERSVSWLGAAETKLEEWGATARAAIKGTTSEVVRSMSPGMGKAADSLLEVAQAEEALAESARKSNASHHKEIDQSIKDEEAFLKKLDHGVEAFGTSLHKAQADAAKASKKIGANFRTANEESRLARERQMRTQHLSAIQAAETSALSTLDRMHADSTTYRIELSEKEANAKIQRDDFVFRVNQDRISDMVSADDKRAAIAIQLAQTEAKIKTEQAEGTSDRIRELRQREYDLGRQLDAMAMVDAQRKAQLWGDAFSTAANSIWGSLKSIGGAISENAAIEEQIRNIRAADQDQFLTDSQRQAKEIRKLQAQQKTGWEIVGATIRDLGSSLIEMIVQEGIKFAATKIIETAISKAFHVTQISGFAAQAAAAAMVSAFSNPFTAPFAAAIGAAAAAQTQAVGLGLMPMARGGEIVGGLPGRDSVPVLAMQGETIVSTDLTRQLKEFLAGQGSGGGTTIRVEQNNHMMTAPTKAQRRKLIEDLGPDLERYLTARRR